MFFGSIAEQNWVPARQWHGQAEGVGNDIAMVLTVTSSLTRYIERRYGMTLKVKLLDQFSDHLLPEEASLLGVPSGTPALRRQASLTHRGSVMFDAESVLPLADISTELMQALEEGREPLGNLLQERGLSLARSDLAVGRMNCSGEGKEELRWARRSVLRSPSGASALVVEAFHELFWKRLRHLNERNRGS